MNRIARHIMTVATLLNKYAENNTRPMDRTPDSETNPKTYSGSALFESGQNDDTILKLIQLTPYITYDNIIAALRLKSKRNNEMSKNELRDFFMTTYQQYNIPENDDQSDDSYTDNAQNNEGQDINNEDIYTLKDLNLLEAALHKLRNHCRISDRNQAKIREKQKELEELENETNKNDIEYNKLKEQMDDPQLSPTEFNNIRKRMQALLKEKNHLDEIEELKKKKEKINKELKYLKSVGPYKDDYESFLYMDVNGNEIDAKAYRETIEKTFEALANKQREISNQIEKLRKKKSLNDDQRKEYESLQQEYKECDEQKKSLQEQLQRLNNKIKALQRRNLYNLINDALDIDLYMTYCPYAALVELIQEKCGEKSKSNKIDINNSKLNLSTSPQVQRACKLIFDNNPSIYDEIIDDIYYEYKRDPDFNDFNPNKFDYKQIKVVHYQSVPNGQGNYIYDDNAKEYVPSDNGNYVQVVKDFNINNLRDITEQENLPRAQTIRSRNEQLSILQNEMKEIQSSSLSKKEKESRLKEIQSKIEKLNELTLPETDSKSNYIMNARIRAFATKLVQSKYRDSQGYIDPYKVAAEELYLKLKEDIKDANDYRMQQFYKQFNYEQFHNLFLRKAEKYAKYIQELDRINPNEKLLREDWRNFTDSKEYQAFYVPNDNEWLSAIIAKYENSGLNNINVTTEQKQNDKNIRNTLIKNSYKSIDELNILKKYNHKIYKNQDGLIDPIIIAWYNLYNNINRLRVATQQKLNANKKHIMELMQQLEEINNNIQKNILIKLKSLRNEQDNVIDYIRAIKFISKALKIDIDYIFINDSTNYLAYKELLKPEQDRNNELSFEWTKELKDYYKQAKFASIQEECKKEYKYRYAEIDTQLAQYNALDRSQYELMNKILRRFRDEVFRCGEELDKVVKADIYNVFYKMIESPSRWELRLQNLIEKLSKNFIDNKEYKNFNVAYLIDILENNINRLGGGTKNFNSIDINEFKNISDSNLTYYKVFDIDTYVDDIIQQSFGKLTLL